MWDLWKTFWPGGFMLWDKSLVFSIIMQELMSPVGKTFRNHLCNWFIASNITNWLFTCTANNSTLSRILSLQNKVFRHTLTTLKQWSREDFSIRAWLPPRYMRKTLKNKTAAPKPTGLQVCSGLALTNPSGLCVCSRHFSLRAS